MFCPKCKCEYRDGFYVCADCNIELVERLEVDNEPEFRAIDPVKVFSTRGGMETEMILNLLRNNGIQCFNEGNFLGGNTKTIRGSETFGSDIFVDKSDYQRAFDLISEVKSLTSDDIEDEWK
jgi:hypothetical protein